MEQWPANEKKSGVVSRRRRGTPERRSGPANGDFPAKSRLGSGIGAVSGTYRPARCFAKADRHPHPGTIQYTAAQWLDVGRDAAVARFTNDDPRVSWAACEVAGRALPGQ